MDLKDRKILYQLDKNARISFSTLGKLVGLSTESAHYRVKRLEEKGIITRYQTAVDYWKLGIIHFKICVSFNGIDLKTEETLYKKLAKIDNIIWIAKCQGEWDCILSCNASNVLEIDIIKDKILSICSKYVLDKKVSISARIWSSPRSYLLGKESSDIFPMGGEQVKLDELDISLLRLLIGNARISIVDIAIKLGSTAKTITARLRRLLKLKVINNFRVVVNYEKTGIHFYKTFIYLKNTDQMRVKRLLGFLNLHPNVVHNLKVIGEWDLEPEFEFFERDGFAQLKQKMLNEFSDIIQKITVIDILKEYKYTFFYK